VKNLASLPWAFRLLLLPAYPLSQLALRAPQITSFRGLNSSTTPVDMQRSVVSFALLVQARCKRASRIRAPQLCRANDGYAAALQTIWHSLPTQRELVSGPNADQPLKTSAAAQYYTNRIGRTGRSSPAERRHQNIVEQMGALGASSLRYDSATFHAGDALEGQSGFGRATI
jgi:hypothetical protein